MSTVIKTKSSPTTGNAPATGSLAAGELAVNVPDKKLWVGTGGGSDPPTLIADYNALGGVHYKRFHEDLKTGILYGGVLSVNGSDAATFDITAGKGIVVDVNASLTGYPNPTVTEVSWAAMTGVTVTNLATVDTTWLHIDSSGALQQMTTPFADTPNLAETGIMLGALVHPNHTTITLARTFPTTSYNSELQSEIFMRSFGGIKLSGHTIQANGTNLKLDRTSGKAFSLGRNYVNDPDLSCVTSDVAKTDATFYRYYRNGSGGFTTVINQTEIDPGNYDDGSGTLASVTPSKWTIQRIFFFPGTPDILGVYYGRAYYNSLSEALANLTSEDFTEISNTQYQAIYCATMIVRGNATDLSSSSQAKIIQAGLFRNTASGGGGAVTVGFDDLNDVTMTSPATNELVYYTGTEWANTSITSLPLVSSVNGSTGAITNVVKDNVAPVFTVPVTTTDLVLSTRGNITFEGFTNDNFQTVLDVVDPTADRTINLPNDSGTVVLENATQILQNKTISYLNNGITITHLNVSNFDEAVQDTASSMITGGTHTAISASYNDGAGTLSLTNTGVTSLNGLTGAMTYSLHRGLFTNTGRYHYPIGCSSTGNGASNVSANNLVLMPFHFPVQAKIDSLGYRTPTGANSASMQYKYGLYTHNYTTGRPETLITTLATGTDPGTANTDVRNTIDYTISPGTYWIGIIFDMTANTIYWNGREDNFMNGFSNTTGTSGKGLYYSVGSFTLDSDLTSVSLLYDTSARTTNISLIMETP